MKKLACLILGLFWACPVQVGAQDGAAPAPTQQDRLIAVFKDYLAQAVEKQPKTFRYVVYTTRDQETIVEAEEVFNFDFDYGKVMAVEFESEKKKLPVIIMLIRVPGRQEAAPIDYFQKINAKAFQNQKFDLQPLDNVLMDMALVQELTKQHKKRSEVYAASSISLNPDKTGSNVLLIALKSAIRAKKFQEINDKVDTTKQQLRKN